MKNGKKQEIYVIWIDEAGRWPLAWPLVMCGILSLSKQWNQIINQCYDSKQTKETERERLFELLLWAKSSWYLDFYTAVIDANTIDLILMRGTLRVAAKEISEYFSKRYWATITFQIDWKHDFDLRKYQFIVNTFIKWDSLIPLISAASIIAKVTRDRLMVKLDPVYPLYGFSTHKWYWTKKHCDSITMHGLSDIHRKSFCGRFLLP